MTRVDYQLVQVRVVRAGPSTAHITIASFAGGQILVPVPTEDLTAVTGLPREQLPGAELTVKANVAATTERELFSDGWWLHSPADHESPRNRAVLPAA